MRLSTQYMYQNNINSMSKAMTAGNDIYTRMSAQRTLLTPSDDPGGASQAIIYQNALANMQQFDTARLYAQDALQQEDNTLTSIGNILTKELSAKIVAGGNGAFSDADREALATELQGIRDNLLSLGNTTNGSGRYIFGGFKTGAEPFQKDGTYVGGDTPITHLVADSTEIQVSHLGSDIFLSGSSNDIFAALDNAIAALNEPIVDDADREALQKTLDSTNIAIKKGIDNLGKIQAEVGTSLQQIESLGLRSDVQKINIQTLLQQTVGSDIDTFITLTSQSKMSEFALSASMMVFQSMQTMSIFNM